MIWLTWRQFRAQAIVAAAALAVIAIALAVTGAHLAHLYDISGIAACQAHSDCGTLTNSFMNQVKASPTYKALYDGGLDAELAPCEPDHRIASSARGRASSALRPM